MKLNSFGKKYKSYAQAVQPKENQQNNNNTKLQKEESIPKVDNKEYLLIIRSLNIQVKMLTTLVKQICYETSERLMSNLRNKSIIDILEDKEFNQIQQDVDTFIANKEETLVEEIRNSESIQIKPKIKKVKFQDKVWV